MQNNPDVLFANAETAFARGEFVQCLQWLDQLLPVIPPHPAILHLRGLAFRKAGRLTEGVEALTQAARLAPDNPQIWNNLGNSLGALEQWAPAITAYEQALAQKPDFADAAINRAIMLHRANRIPEAKNAFETLCEQLPRQPRIWLARAAMERDAGDLSAAKSSYTQALTLEPGNSRALYGLARTELEQGSARSVSLFRQLAAAHPQSTDTVTGLAEALEAAGEEGAIELLDSALRDRPGWIEGHRLLTRMRAEQEGCDGDFTRSFASVTDAEAHATPAFWYEWGNALAHAGRHREALSLLDQAPPALLERETALMLARALWTSEAGDVEQAENLFESLPLSFDGVAENRSRHWIRRRWPERVVALLENRLDQKGELSVGEWAYLGLAWRMADDPRQKWLFGEPGYFGTETLELDSALLQPISDAIRSLHRTRHHPLSQSLRGGTQTRGRLFDNPMPEVQILYRSIRDAINRFIATLPPADPRHPLLRARNATPRITGSWSVRLTGQGFHVHHIHREGWLSSACYLTLPDEVAADDDRHKGWLAVGSAPDELMLAMEPLALIRPKPGSVALFPSYLFHGTIPFTKGERMTIAFDVVNDLVRK